MSDLVFALALAAAVHAVSTFLDETPAPVDWDAELDRITGTTQ